MGHELSPNLLGVHHGGLCPGELRPEEVGGQRAGAAADDLVDRQGDDPSEFVIDEVAGQWIAILFPAIAFWTRGWEGWLPWPAI